MEGGEEVIGNQVALDHKVEFHSGGCEEGVVRFAVLDCLLVVVFACLSIYS